MTEQILTHPRLIIQKLWEWAQTLFVCKTPEITLRCIEAGNHASDFTFTMLAQLHSVMSAIISTKTAKGEDQGKQNNKFRSQWERKTLSKSLHSMGFQRQSTSKSGN